MGKGTLTISKDGGTVNTYPSYFAIGDGEKLAVVDLAQSIEAKRIAEIGVFQGDTTLYLVGHTSQITIYSIDIWENRNTFLGFIDKTRQYISAGRVVPIMFSSLEAVNLFPDSWFDLVFIDADHSYQAVCDDIKAWLPKVRIGGILSGHDCEKRYCDMTESEKKLVDDYQWDESKCPIGHAGVIKALSEYFGSDYKICPETKVWFTKNMV